MDNILEESMRWFALFEDVLISISKFISVCSCPLTSVFTIGIYDVENNFVNLNVSHLRRKSLPSQVAKRRTARKHRL